MEAKKKEVLEEIKIIQKNYKKGSRITRDHWLEKTKFSQKVLDEYWDGSFVKLREEGIKFQRTGLEIIRKNDSEKDVIFITSILPESNLNKPFWQSVKTLEKKRNAEIVLLTMRGVHHEHKFYTPEVQELYKYYATEFHLCSNLKALDIQEPPQSPDATLKGLHHTDDGSIIIASPKQNFRSVAVIDRSKPKSVISTGTITTRKYAKTHSGFLAEKDAVIGGVIVEIDRKTDTFFWRFVRANYDGSFYDLDKQYCPDGTVKKVSAEYLVVGDVHSGFTDEYARKASIDMANALNVKTVGGGDWMDGYSVSHHHNYNMKLKVKKMEEKGHVATLENELKFLAKELSTWKEGLKEGIEIDLIASNHHEHLDRYLHEQRFFNDVPNYRIALELALADLDDKNIIQYYIEKHYPDLRKGLNWLTRKTIKYVSTKKILVSEHGDNGPNGTRSTNVNAEYSLQACVLAHSHSPSVLRKVFRVGTLALELEYQKGSSSHQNMNCVIYRNGVRQMIWIAPDGRYKL
jgi:hypothetical protein